MTILWSDNFDSDTAGVLPSGWTALSGTWVVGTQSPVSGTQTLSETSLTDKSVVVYSNLGYAQADQTVSVDFIYAAQGVRSRPAPLARMQSGANSGYGVLLGGTGDINLVVYRYAAGVSVAEVTTAHGVTLTTGTAYTLEISCVGTTISGRIYLSGGTRPTTAQVTYTGTTYTAGAPGIYNNLNAAPTPGGFDNFVFTDAVTTAATAYTLTGPSSGIVGVASTNFTVTANGAVTGTNTITPSDGGAGGTFTPTTVVFSSSSVTGTFTYTPASAGAKSISTTNSGSLTNPSALTYTASVAATAVTLSGPTSGATGVASTNFTVGANGTLTSSVIVTPNDSSGGGTFTPTSITISSGSPTGTFTYTPASAGAKIIGVTNNGSLTNPSTITYTASSASATATTLTGPTSGTVGVASSAFSVAANGVITGTLVVTPSDSSAGGTFSPTTVSLTSAAPTGTFTYTASATGAKSIGTTNNQSLTNPSAITYTASAVAATALTLTGPTTGITGQASSAFTVAANGAITGTVTVTPNDSSGGGTFSPTTIVFTSSSVAGTFTYTPSSIGAKSINVTNNGSLANPTSIAYLSTSVPVTTTTTSSIGLGFPVDKSGQPIVNGAPLLTVAQKALNPTGYPVLVNGGLVDQNGAALSVGGGITALAQATDYTTNLVTPLAAVAATANAAQVAAPPQFYNSPLVGYGCSYDAQDINNRTGTRALVQLNAQWKSVLTNWAVSGTLMQDFSGQAIGTVGPYATSSYGIGWIGNSINDSTRATPGPTNAGQIAGYQNSLATIIYRMLSSSVIAETASNFVFDSNWTASGNAAYGSGALMGSKVVGATCTVTTPVCTDFVILTRGLAIAAGTGTLSITVDGVAYPSVTNVGAGTSPATTSNSAPYPMVFTGLSNTAHTVVLTKTDSSTLAAVYVDDLYVLTRNPALILIEKSCHIQAAGYVTQAGGGSDSSVDTYNGYIDTVVANVMSAFPYARICISNPQAAGWNTATMIGTADGIHPNDYGQNFRATVANAAAAAYMKNIGWVDNINKI